MRRARGQGASRTRAPTFRARPEPPCHLPSSPSRAWAACPASSSSPRDGARAEVYLHGAHVTSWHPAGETFDRLFVSDRGDLHRATPPSAAACRCAFRSSPTRAALPMHGFVRAMAWQLVAAGRQPDGTAAAHLRCRRTDATRALWPHAFTLDYTVTIGRRTLALALAVHNRGQRRLRVHGGAAHLPARARPARHAACTAWPARITATRCWGCDDAVETRRGAADRSLHRSRVPRGAARPRGERARRRARYPHGGLLRHRRVEPRRPEERHDPGHGGGRLPALPVRRGRGRAPAR